MKTLVNPFAAAVLLLAVAPAPCFALWGVEQVTQERAKELGLVIRAIPAGPNDVRVELEFKPEGELKNFHRVDLRAGEEGKSLVAALKEDRPEPGRVVVAFAASRANLDQIQLWIMVPEILGGTAYELRMKEFVDLDKLSKPR